MDAGEMILNVLMIMITIEAALAKTLIMITGAFIIKTTPVTNIPPNSTKVIYVIFPLKILIVIAVIMVINLSAKGTVKMVIMTMVTIFIA